MSTQACRLLSVRKPQMKRTVFFLVLGIFFLTACSKDKEHIIVQGIFEAESILVSSPVDGLVASMPVREGSRLLKNDTIAQVDTMFYAFQRDYILTQQQIASSAGVVSPATQTEALNVQIAALEREYQRVAALVEKEIVAHNRLDEIEAKLDAARAQLKASLEQLDKKNAASRGTSSSLDKQLGQVEELMARATIQAPIDGVVLSTYVREGEYTAMGRPLLKLADLSSLTLRIYFTSEQLMHIKLGDILQVATDMGVDDGRRYEGEVIWISEEAEFTPKNIQTSSMRSSLIYAAKLLVPNDGYLKIGQYGKAVIPIQHDK